MLGEGVAIASWKLHRRRFGKRRVVDMSRLRHDIRQPWDKCTVVYLRPTMPVVVWLIGTPIVERAALADPWPKRDVAFLIAR